MPRSWAQEWKTDNGQRKYTAHRNKSDIKNFQGDHNIRCPEGDELREVGTPWMFNSSPEIYQRLCNVWGIFWPGRPGND